MSETIELTTSIARVTVFEDRADVIREAASVELPAGSAVIVVKDLPAVISDEHVVARLEPLGAGARGVPGEHGGQGFVNDVRVDRRIVGGDDELAARRLARQKDIELLDDEVAAAEDAHQRALRVRGLSEIALRRFVEAVARGAGRGDGGAAEWAAGLSALEKALAAADSTTHKARLDVGAAKRKRQRAADDLRVKPTSQRTIAELRLRVSSSGGKFKLVISTLSPCAAWRPSHEARVRKIEDKRFELEFVTYAAVWNRTGEAWRDVELVLSTARPSAGAELPPLRADRLELRQKTAEERRTIVVEHREEGVPKTATQGTAPGVDDGGEPRVFKAARASIPDDGRPHRVEVARFDAPCALERVAYPELVPQVFLRASLKNAGKGPILAGAVTLLEGGAYVGTGDVLYVGVGEAFDLSFGSDDRFVVRTKKRRVEDKKLVGKDVVHFIREVTLVHTGTTTERVLVHVRLPVSEVKQLRVLPSPQHSTDPLDADEHGIVRLPVELLPNVEKKIALAFSFDTSGDVRIPDPW